jgi:hypothetical protein
MFNTTCPELAFLHVPVHSHVVSSSFKLKVHIIVKSLHSIVRSKPSEDPLASQVQRSKEQLDDNPPYQLRQFSRKSAKKDPLHGSEGSSRRPFCNERLLLPEVEKEQSSASIADCESSSVYVY